MELKLPELGEGVHEGELIKWRVKVGDFVKDDQPLCEVMTDKATVELPAPFSGKVVSLTAKEGDVIHVNQVILTYDAGGKSQSPAAAASAPAPAAPQIQAPAPAPAGAAQAVARTPEPALAAPAPLAANVLAAPSTRRFAREAGVDLGRVPGTGPHGRVLREDVEGFLKGSAFPAASSSSAPRGAFEGTGAVAGGPPAFTRQQPAVGTEERIAFRGLRKKIAEKMHESKSTAAHFTYVEECDATALVALRARAKELAARQGIKLTYLPFVMKAMVAALRRFPVLNSHLDTERNEIVVKHYYHIGLSVQTDDGLTVPVVKNVDQKSVFQIAREIQELVEKARARKLAIEDLKGGTITLTNAGSIGGLFATPVINFPEVAIVGFNKIARKPVVVRVDGREEIAIRDWTYFSISLDHRIVDGAIAAEFMKVFIEHIEEPSLLLLEG
jgi:pyruvate dehydrogenase E2 component (dihydrolipoamide acetyltransferase)